MALLLLREPHLGYEVNIHGRPGLWRRNSVVSMAMKGHNITKGVRAGDISRSMRHHIWRMGGK